MRQSPTAHFGSPHFATCSIRLPREIGRQEHERHWDVASSQDVPPPRTRQRFHQHFHRRTRSGMIRLKWPSLFFFYLQIEIHELYTPGKVTFPKGSSLPTIIFQGRTVKLRVFFFGKKLTQKVVTRNGLFGGILMRRGDLELDCFDIQN